MAKKIIKNEAKEQNRIEGLLANTGQPIPKVADSTNAENRNSAPDSAWTHFTVICSIELVEKMKAIAQKEGFSIRDIVERSFKKSIASYESKHGKIKVKPKRQKNIADVF